MKLRNTHPLFTDEQIKAVFEFVRLPGCENLTLQIKPAKRLYSGRAYLGQRRLLAKAHHTPRGYPMFYRPYQYGQLRGHKYWIASALELLVVIMAHEARHFWQHAKGNHGGYIWGGRGKYSEIDTDCYAIKMLRAWRRA